MKLPLLDRDLRERVLVETALRAWIHKTGADRLAATPLDLAQRCHFEPDGWQRDVLSSDANRLLLLCSRQAGKSTVTSLLALHSAMSGELCLVLSPTERQSIELLLKAKEHIAALNSPTVGLVRESDTTFRFANGGRLIALPGAKEGNVRGFSGVGLLILDEASRVPDELYQAVRPMLAVSGGRLVLLSTPFGKRGFFWQAWESTQKWHRVKVTAQDCPRISPEFLAEERATLGELVFKSEYLCEFVDTEESVFASEHVHAALDVDLAPLFGAAA